MKCKICNYEFSKTIKVKERMFGLDEEFEYGECGNCFCLQLLNPPEDFSKYYSSESYYSKAKDFRKQGKLRKMIFKSALGYGITHKIYTLLTSRSAFSWLHTIKPKLTDKILDVGSGHGELLHNLYDNGYKNLIGIDLFLDNEVVDLGDVKLYKKEVFDFDEKFDFIMLHHVFEHMPNPREVLLKVHDLLADDGVCIVRIPFADSYAYEKYGADWYQIDAPRHFFLHTKKSMQILLKNSGLVVEEIAFDSNGHQFLLSEFNSRGKDWNAWKKKKMLSVFMRAKLFLYNLHAMYLNYIGRGDQVIYILKKQVN